MNQFKILFLFFLLSTISSSAQGHIVKARLNKIAEAFTALSEPERIEYIKHKNKAFKARENEKYLTCLIEIDDAQAIFKKDMDLLFLKGICHAQLHDVDKAVSYYDKVLEIDNTHIFTLMNVIEINYFSGRYEETIKYIKRVNSIVDSRANGQYLPLLDFKYLISLTKLSKKEPAKYKTEMEKLRAKYTFMDDHAFYYYANALALFDADDKQEGLIWILKAYLIFKDEDEDRTQVDMTYVDMIKVWNKALIDTGYIGAHEIMFNRQEQK